MLRVGRSRLEDKRFFTNVTWLGSGVPLAVAFLWMFGSYGGLGFWLFLVVIAIVASRISAFLMWYAFKGVYNIEEREEGRK